MSDGSSYQQFSGSKVRGNVSRLARNENFVLGAILVVLVVMFTVTTRGVILRPGNVRNFATQASVTGLATVGQAFVILTGGIDLSVGGTAAMALCLGAALMTTTPGYLGPIGAGPAVLIMLLVGAGFGAVNGLVVTRLRVSPLITTLATWHIALGLASHFAALSTGKPVIILELPKVLAVMRQGGIGGVSVAAVVFIAVFIIGYFILNHTSFGKSVYAVGGSEASAWLSGIKPRNIKFWVYLVSGLFTAIAGLLQMTRVLAASTQLMGALELDTIAAVVVGGVSLFGGGGNLIGVLMGVLIIGVANNGMNLMGLNAWLQNMVKGGTIFAVVAIDARRRNRSGG